MGSSNETKEVNLVEIRDRCDVDQVDDGKVLNLFCDRIQGLVHGHTLRVPVMTESDDDDAVFLRLDGFVDVPPRGEMGKKVRHGCRDEESDMGVAVSASLPREFPMTEKTLD